MVNKTIDNFNYVLRQVINEYNDNNVQLLDNTDSDIVKVIAKQWYLGDVQDVHHYKIFNGKRKIDKTRKSLGLVKQSSETIANLLLNEKCDVILGDEKDKLLMDKILTKTNYWTRANQSIELAFALGYSAWVEGVDGLKVDEEGNIINDGTGTFTCDFIDNSKIEPLIVDSGKITDCAFIQFNTLNTEISVHCLDRRKESNTYGTYVIVNITLDKNGTEILKKQTIYTMSDVAWFQLVKPNVVNNYTINSAIGIPFWYNAKDVLAAIDCAYDSLDCEIRNGKRKTFINEDLLVRYIDKEGRQVEPFDPNDSDFYFIPKEDTDKQMIVDSAPNLRVDQITAALNMHLNAFSSKLGFGENFYVYNVQKNIQTATQVISENAQLFRTIKKHEILLEESMLSFFQALVYITNNFTQDKFSENASESLSIHFDDSIIEDKGTEKTSDRADIQSGAMSNVEYRMKWYGEDEETATNKVVYLDIAKMYDSLSASLAAGQLTPEQFVELVKLRFPKLNTEGLAEYIAENNRDSIVQNPFEEFVNE